MEESDNVENQDLEKENGGQASEIRLLFSEVFELKIKHAFRQSRGYSIMGWSNWKRFCEIEWENIPENSGAYYIRCVNKFGKPINIVRLGGVDKEGIIYIGESGRNLRSRLKNF